MITTSTIAVLFILIMPVVIGMLFGRNAPHRPECNTAG